MNEYVCMHVCMHGQIKYQQIQSNIVDNILFVISKPTQRLYRHYVKNKPVLPPCFDHIISNQLPP